MSPCRMSDCEAPALQISLVEMQHVIHLYFISVITKSENKLLAIAQGLYAFYCIQLIAYLFF